VDSVGLGHLKDLEEALVEATNAANEEALDAALDLALSAPMEDAWEECAAVPPTAGWRAAAHEDLGDVSSPSVGSSAGPADGEARNEGLCNTPKEAMEGCWAKGPNWGGALKEECHSAASHQTDLDQALAKAADLADTQALDEAADLALNALEESLDEAAGAAHAEALLQVADSTLAAGWGAAAAARRKLGSQAAFSTGGRRAGDAEGREATGHRVQDPHGSSAALMASLMVPPPRGQASLGELWQASRCPRPLVPRELHFNPRELASGSLCGPAASVAVADLFGRHPAVAEVLAELFSRPAAAALTELFLQNEVAVGRPAFQHASPPRPPAPAQDPAAEARAVAGARAAPAFGVLSPSRVPTGAAPVPLSVPAAPWATPHTCQQSLAMAKRMAQPLDVRMAHWEDRVPVPDMILGALYACARDLGPRAPSDLLTCALADLRSVMACALEDLCAAVPCTSR